MKAVNLLPPDYSGSQRRSVGNRFGSHPVAVGGTAAAVVAVGALGFAWSSASSTASSNQKQLAALQVQLAAIDKTAQPASNGVSARLSEITMADASRVSWDGFMSRLGRVLPEDVWLTGLVTANAPAVDPAAAAAAASTSTSTSSSSTPAPAPAPVVAPTGFTVTGYTYSQKSIARLMRRLQLLPWLTGIQLQSSQLTTVGTNSAFQFTITGGVNSLPAKEAS